jgi:STE24 endopeptidase
LFWRAEDTGSWVILGQRKLGWVLLVVLGQPVIFGCLAFLAARRTRRLLFAQPENPHLAQHSHHRTTVWLRAGLIAGFAVAVLLTDWPALFDLGRYHPTLQIFGDLIVLSPFVAGMIATWIASFPLESALRSHPVGWDADSPDDSEQVWSLRTYLDFNLRHQLLVVAAPMTLILFAADVIRGYEEPLQALGGWVWTPDLLLGAVALGVFIIAPAMLIRVWRTAPLDSEPLRARLESLCSRIGLRCRAILVWRSEGIMINAAVMGIVPAIRYVLLSDALLTSMTPRQIEAVFAHEAGHIKKHHIQNFLLFAFVGWLLVAGLMELLARSANSANPTLDFSIGTIQGVGLLATVLFWTLGFGSLSRRFERQADLFGARAVTPDASECKLPCSVHPDADTTLSHAGRVCATGASVFAAALDRVAVLNGIPHEERSWRHSSIGSRIRFLTSMAGDPRRAARFDRFLRIVRFGMVVLAVLGAVGTVYYWTVVPEPAILQLEAGGA